MDVERKENEDQEMVEYVRGDPYTKYEEQKVEKCQFMVILIPTR